MTTPRFPIYIRKRGVIYRIFQSDKSESGKQFTQLVVSKRLRTEVLSLTHESIMTGHLGTFRTTKKVLAEFYWPGVQADVRRFVDRAISVNGPLLREGLPRYHWDRCLLLRCHSEG